MFNANTAAMQLTEPAVIKDDATSENDGGCPVKAVKATGPGKKS